MLESHSNHEIYAKVFEAHPSCFSLFRIVKATRRSYKTELVSCNQRYRQTFKKEENRDEVGFHEVIGSYFNHFINPDRMIQNMLGEKSQVEFYVYSELLESHFAIQAYTVGHDHFVAMFDHISHDRRNHDKSIDAHLELTGMLKDLKQKNDSLKRMNERLFYDSVTDNLTRAFNRQFLIYSLECNIKAFEKNNQPFCLALFDIDNFKRINDQFGHLTGDRILVELSMSVKEAIRENDVFGRYGGDEFILVLPKTDAETGKAIAERVRKQIEDAPRFALMNVTLSGGILSYDNEGLSTMLQSVDDRLYQAKNNGKNKVIG